MWQESSVYSNNTMNPAGINTASVQPNLHDPFANNIWSSNWASNPNQVMNNSSEVSHMSIWDPNNPIPPTLGGGVSDGLGFDPFRPEDIWQPSSRPEDRMGDGWSVVKKDG